MCLVAVAVVVAGCGGSARAQIRHGASPAPVVLTSGSGPAKKYDCVYDVRTEAFTGAYATASAIGWEGNHQGVVTCLGGTFYVQDGINRNFGFGIYNGSPTTWVDADGYLPAQTTTFRADDAGVAITEFADELEIGGDEYVAVYSRVNVHNGTDRTVVANPEPSPGMVELDQSADAVAPHGSSIHDYVVAVDRFGNDYPWPTPRALAAAGGFDEHFAHMSAFWNSQLDGIAEVHTPDAQLDDAYRSGFIYTQIARSGDDLDTGVNGYESQFSHDVIGILANLFTQGSFADAHALLYDARYVVGSQGQYDDGIWSYAWPWAIYLMKTGDVSFVSQNFDTDGPAGKSEPSIEATAHLIAASRTGPGGIMEETDDIDTFGYWTVDDYEALTGLAAYGYIARRLGEGSQAEWAADQYDSLLRAVNARLDATIDRYHLDYLPCSLTEPNSMDVCSDPQNANWAATFQFGKWAWDAQLFGAQVFGPGLALIDSTYSYGFDRLKTRLPPDTFGGYPPDLYSTAYNAGYGSWGLASEDHRDQGILGYEFMIAYDQSGPYSWWESSSPPTPGPWVGTHPGAGQGSSPHAWGMSEANKVLLDSLVAQESDGDLLVGRGVPAAWLAAGSSISVTDFPTTDGHRSSIRIRSTGRSVSLSVSGRSAGEILFELPSFADDIASVSSGVIDEGTGTVTLPAATTGVTVQLRTPAESGESSHGR